MDGIGDRFRPVWRTPIAMMLLAWMGLAVGALLGAWRAVEILPPTIAVAMALSIFVAAPAVLLVWAFWTMMRDPVTGWIAPSALLAFGGAMIPAWEPLLDYGARLNFETHRAAYDAIVADGRSGRLRATAAGASWVMEDRQGVVFRYRPSRPGRIDFVWSRGAILQAGVRYDAEPCRPTLRMKCLAAGAPLTDGYSHYRYLFRP
jgi:hypothetical protein